jgi:GT2 family glycosyltransferase
MDLSVIIPTHRRPAKLAACLTRLAGQTLGPARFEVLVALDGPDEGSARAAYEAWAGCAARLLVVPCPRRGLNAARNELLKMARGRLLVSMNDDVLPEPGCLEAHAAAHAQSRRPVVIAGYSPFVAFEPETLFGALARGTSMIFFYDQMVRAGAPLQGPGHDWGFRHCWGLNFSAPLEAVREVGGFVSFPLCYGYDDIELAWRLKDRLGAPVLFRPEARADHDHRYTPRDVLEREFRLGQAAHQFAGRNPAFAAEVFGRDIRSEAELAYSGEFVQREAGAAERLERSFLGLGDLPAAAMAGPAHAELLNLIYQQHLLLKRWHWRRGLLAAASLLGAEPHPEPRAGVPTSGVRVVQV